MAAGCASRFGSTKQAIELDGTSLVQSAAATASRVCGDHVVTVLGHDRVAVFEAMAASSGFIVVNDDFAAGLGTSIAAAARACRNVADAMIVMLADQPLISAGHLRQLVAAWSGAADEIVASSYAGTRGPPALFPELAFEALSSLTGDEGARLLFQDARFSVKSVHFEAAAIDIDTPDDLDSLA